MNIKILYDNQAENGFASGWGFSALIDDTTLFDVGEDAESLLANINVFGVNLNNIQRVVLSHEDWDHIGGIEVIKECGKVDVYLPAAFSTGTRDKIRQLNPQATIVDVRTMQEMAPNLYVTTQLGLRKKEISLVVQSDKGVVLVVGCSHPGLDRIMKGVRALGPIYGVIGGFHGFRKLRALAGVSYIAPTHCTRQKEAIRTRYPDQTHLVGAGSVVNL